MSLTVRYVRLLAFPFDAKRQLPRIEATFAGSGIAVVPWAESHEPHQLPAWFAVHFEAQHGSYGQLRDDVLERLNAADLASEFKAEGVYA
jgi:hypothetical protein